MKRRLIAWALLTGFVLLILNILFIGFYRTLSAFIYIVIALAFIFISKADGNNNS